MGFSFLPRDETAIVFIINKTHQVSWRGIHPESQADGSGEGGGRRSEGAELYRSVSRGG